MYDITIIGAGISGIFLAYTLLQTERKFKILMIEKGRKFVERICPIESAVSKKCVDCKICNKIQGFGGMARSEGKFNYTNDFGGDLGKKIGKENSMKLMKDTDKILCSFGADKVRLYNTENKELSGEAKDNNCKILTTKVRHLGTSLSYEFLNKIYLYLKDKIDIRFETDITSIDKRSNVFYLNSEDKVFQSRVVVLATGMSGGERFLEYCKAFDINPNRTRIDLGIRVEMKCDELDPIIKDSFETKIHYKDEEFEATTYCMNPKGKVIKKHQEGLVMADGQNCFETNKPSENLNFTVFVPRYFSSLYEAKEYAASIIKPINQSRERIVCQRLEDLIKKRATTKEQLDKNSIQPTLKGEGGNLYNVIPNIYIDGVVSILDKIEKLIGKKVHKDTLLYGIDAKFYEPEIGTNEYFETKEKGLYVIGDCSGITYSLSQAAASGVYLGKHFLKY